jgi:transposase InsO family protein
VLKVARSTYYNHILHKESNRFKENQKLKNEIMTIYNNSKCRYGCVKITHILRQNGYPKISVNRVLRLMRQLEIKSITIKKFKNYRQKQQDIQLDNLVNQNFFAFKPNQIWLSDITYIHTIKHGWTYLASVLDVCTRKIVGYHYSRKMDKSLVISALKNAYVNQGCPQNVIIHSDRGSQYTSHDYIKTVSRFKMKLSYSKKGCPFDNAPMEAFHACLKKEEVYIYHYQTFEQAKLSLFEYIEGFYNRNRIHSAINFYTPIAFEKACLAS